MQAKQVDGQIGKYKFWCQGECQQNMRASDLLLVNHGQDWCGNVIMICKQCVGWTGSDQAFSKIVKQRWTFRSKSLFDKVKNLRGLKWDFVENYYEEKIPGVKWKGRRGLMVAHLKLIMFTVGNDIFQDNPHAQAAYRMVGAQWLKCVQDQATTPFQIPAAMGWSISAHDAQHLTRLTKHTNVSFICRDCGYFGPHWGQAVTGNWHFRCYYCGTLYSPWKIVAGKSAYNRIFAMEDPVANHVQVIPAWWPQTTEDNWLAGMAETFARQIKCPEDLEAFAAKAAVDI